MPKQYNLGLKTGVVNLNTQLTPRSNNEDTCYTVVLRVKRLANSVKKGESSFSLQLFKIMIKGQD